MKKIFAAIALVMMSTTIFAQSAAELAKQQKELNEINMKMVNAKPSKSAKKQAKEYEKDGWKVMAGSKDLAQQITESQLLGEELMVAEDGSVAKRFIQHSATQVAGTYNAAYAASRNVGMVEMAAVMKTQVAAAMQAKLDNQQTSAITAVTVEKFNERAKSIVDATMTNVRPMLVIYRVLSNQNYEVQVRLAFDKKELAARMKRAMQKELEMEGDELNGIVDDVLKGDF